MLNTMTDEDNGDDNNDSDDNANSLLIQEGQVGVGTAGGA